MKSPKQRERHLLERILHTYRSYRRELGVRHPDG